MAAAIKRAEEAAKAARLQADEATAATKKAEVRAAMLAPLAVDRCCDPWCVLMRIRDGGVLPCDTNDHANSDRY